ncbi:MAG: hypothetical protein KDC23_09090, partial [Actinobacteria bacterium]|nr:hypothetical protein [Actinomycetota bacterium]
MNKVLSNRFLSVPIAVLALAAALLLGAPAAHSNPVVAQSSAGVAAEPQPVPQTHTVGWGSDVEGQIGAVPPGQEWTTPAPTQPGALGDGSFEEVSAGLNFSCGLTAAGEVFCWGANGAGQLGIGTPGPDVTQPVQVVGGQQGGEFLQGVKQLSVGSEQACALTESGELFCWGWNEYGQVGNGSDTPDVVPAPVRVVGGEQGGQFLTDVVQVDAGNGNHTCVVVDGGGVYCWGWNMTGQLGNDQGGLDEFSGFPVQVVAGQQGQSGFFTDAVEVAVGGLHTCARVETEGEMYCWGSDGVGQLGDGVQGDWIARPQRVVAGETSDDPAEEFLSGADEVVAGSNNTCARLGYGVACWGDGEIGQLGNGQSGSGLLSAEPVWVLAGEQTEGGEDLGDVMELTAGFDHECAVVESTGEVYCWGYNSKGQLGNGSTGAQMLFSSVPVKVLGIGGQGVLQQGVTISGGGEHTMAVLLPAVPPTSTDSWAWGSNAFGTLGNSGYPFNVAAAPIPVAAGQSADQAFVTVAAGGFHSCGVTAAGEVFCWGLNATGQVGTGTEGGTFADPVQVVGGQQGGQFLTDVVAVSLGVRHTCALTDAGEVYCWGENDSGQLGDGDSTNSAIPMRVLAGEQGAGFLSGVAQLDAGGYSACALLDDGSVFCWGSNKHGQLGNGQFVPPDFEAAPVQVVAGEQATNGVSAATGGLAGVQTLSAGDTTACAVANGEVLCWGNNEFGQLGDGKSEEQPTSNVPVRTLGVGGTGFLTGIESVAAGASSTCAIRDQNAQVLCWGDNEFGQLANDQAPGTELRSDVPVESLDPTGQEPLVGMDGVSVGQIGACGNTAQGGVLCWGSNTVGEVGSGLLPSQLENALLPMPVAGPNGAGLLGGIGQVSMTNSHAIAVAASVPSAPHDLVATPGYTTAVVDFQFGPDGGLPVTGVEYSIDGGGSWVPTGSTAPQVNVSDLPNGVPTEVKVRAVNAVGPGASASVSVTPLGAVFSGLESSFRVFDSRVSQGGPGPLTPGVPVTVDVQAPAGAVAVSYNLTLVGTVGSGHVAVGPAGADLSGTSTANWFASGQRWANAYVSSLGQGGSIQVVARGGQTDAIVDVTGFYLADGQTVPAGAGQEKPAAGGATAVMPTATADSLFVPTAPKRAYDSRGIDGPIFSGQERTIDLDLWVPAGATGVAYTVTVTETVGAGHLAVGVPGEGNPGTSVINWFANGQNVANSATAAVNEAREISVFAGGGPTEFIIDILGYFTPVAAPAGQVSASNGQSGLRFTAIAPSRAYDSRASDGPIAGGQSRTTTVIPASSQVPAGVGAVAFNL